MFDTDDVNEAKRMLPIYKRAVDLLETVSGKKTEQAEQEPVAIVVCNRFGVISLQRPDGGNFNLGKNVGMKFYAAPVRTKDLTDDEIMKAWDESDDMTLPDFARAVISADREKNK